MKKRYRVTGETVVAGHRPGETFEHDYLPHEEAALIESGAIAVAKPAATPPKQKEN